MGSFLLYFVLSILGRFYAQALTAAEIKEFLDRHNAHRRAVVPGASDMIKMQWNDTLAKLAQAWTEKCIWEHPSSATYPEYKGLGQNLAVDTASPLSISNQIMRWDAEKKDHVFSTGCASGKVCGHYTQVVWSTSYMLGCGYHKCATMTKLDFKNAFLVACQYSPPGNIDLKPYKDGAACSACPSTHPHCDAKLCSTESGAKTITPKFYLLLLISVFLAIQRNTDY